MNTPSPLQPPRHFEHPPLSAWSFQDRRVAAPKDAFEDVAGFKPLGHPSNLGDYEALVEHKTNPIGIEIVRGARGVHDGEWTVLVDGMRCRTSEINGRIRCILPPGVAKEELTRDTKVRPLAVAVRLEEDALAPMSAQVSIHQVLSSSERLSQDKDALEELPDGPPIPLTPYRVGDVSANAAQIMYPLWSPAQPVIGIMSLIPANRLQERRSWAVGYNAMAFAFNSAVNSYFFVQNSAWEQLKEDVTVSRSFQDMAKNIGRITNLYKTSDLNFDELKEIRKEVLRSRPKRTKNVTAKAEPADPKKPALTYVIGDTNESAVSQLAYMLNILADIVEEIYKSESKPSLRELLLFVRIRLNYYGDAELAALFDALLSSDPHPIAKTFFGFSAVLGDNVPDLDKRKLLQTANFRQEYIVQKIETEEEKTPEEIREDDFDTMQRNLDAGAVGSSATETPVFPQVAPTGVDADTARAARDFSVKENKFDQDLTPDDRKKLQTDLDDAFEKESARARSYESDYMFTYDRLSMVNRKSTMVYSRVRVTIVDYDGSDKVFEFEASETNGIVAHAVYSEYANEVYRLDAAGRRFVRSIFQVYTERGVVAQVDDKLAKLARFFQRWTFSAYVTRAAMASFPFPASTKPASSTAPDQTLSRLFSLRKIAKYASAQVGNTVKSYLGLDGRMELDPLRLEERVAELRLMAREIIPVWPPVPEPELPDLPAPIADTNDPDGGLNRQQQEVGAPLQDAGLPSLEEIDEFFQLCLSEEQHLLTTRDYDKMFRTAVAMGVPRAHVDSLATRVEQTGAPEAAAPPAAAAPPETEEQKAARQAREALEAEQRRVSAVFRKQLQEQIKNDEEERKALAEEYMLNEYAKEVRAADANAPYGPDVAEFKPSGVTDKAKSDDRSLVLTRVLPHIVLTKLDRTLGYTLPADTLVNKTSLETLLRDQTTRGFFSWDTAKSIGTALLSLALGTVASVVLRSMLSGAIGGLVAEKRAAGLFRQFFNFMSGLGTAGLSGASLFSRAQVANLFATFGPGLVKASFQNLFDIDLFGQAGQKVYQDFAVTLQSWSIGLTGASIVHSYQRNRAGPLREDALRKHILDVHGNPIKTCVGSAKNAVAVYKKRREQFAKRNKIQASDIKVVYRMEGELEQEVAVRFTFFELFLVQDDESVTLAMGAYGRIFTTQQWLAIPYSTATQPLPPSDVSEVIFETEELRGIRANAAIQFTSGTGEPLSGATPVEVASRAAVEELLRVILSNRKDFRGEHLVESTAESLADLTSKGALLVSLAYGLSEGLVFVNGDDVLWTCLPGGVFARMALRHLDVFLRFEKQVAQKLKTIAAYWSYPRRTLVDRFATLMKQEAKAILRRPAALLDSGAGIADVAIDSARSFARVSTLCNNNAALSDQSVSAALLTVASYTAYRIASTPNKVEESLVSENLVSELGFALSFSDQTILREPTPRLRSTSEIQMVWASRRFAAQQSRQMRLPKTPITGTVVTRESNEAVEKLATQLSRIGVDESNGFVPPSNGGDTSTYYCPMGSRIYALPGNRPIDTLGMSTRTVWLAHMRDALRQLSFVPFSDRGAKDVRIEAFHVTDSYEVHKLNEISGLARHPLSVTVNAARKRVYVPLSKPVTETSASPTSPAPKPAVFSLVDALETLKRERGDYTAVNNAVMKLRTGCFNAERFLFGLQLAAHAFDGAQTFSVTLPSSAHVAALAMGLAMELAETGAIAFNLLVMFKLPETGDAAADQQRANEELESADLQKNNLINQATGAVREGCMQSLLSELAVAV